MVYAVFYITANPLYMLGNRVFFIKNIEVHFKFLSRKYEFVIGGFDRKIILALFAGFYSLFFFKF